MNENDPIVDEPITEDAWLRRNPPHPGRTIRDGCLVDGMTVGEAATKLGVARHTLSRVLNGKSGISPEMALRLEAVGWSNAAFWMRLQSHYDLAQARKRLEARTKAA